MSPAVLSRLKDALLGGPKNVLDPHVHHTLALVALLAWIGLGADGLSSSSYGPEEAFLNLGGHFHLALYLMLAMVGVLLGIVISYVTQAGLLKKFPTMRIELSAPWIFYAAAIALAGALLGALYPAFKGAQKDPIDALAYE